MSVTSRAVRAIAAVTLTAAAGLAPAAEAQAEGNFVIGNQSAIVGAPVTFWGAQWWKLNSLSGGSAPPAFKGFADTVLPPTCGGVWSTDPGDSSDPPAGPLPPMIEAIVSSSIVKSGRTISGDTSEVVLVATNPGYEPDPGHAGTGTVLAVVCGGEEGKGSAG
ncbi:MAG: hypothetical protein ACLQBB_05670 [Solirubrobacteraceae bacterium]